MLLAVYLNYKDRVSVDLIGLKLGYPESEMIKACFYLSFEARSAAPIFEK
jgi:hypothetical protein